MEEKTFQSISKKIQSLGLAFQPIWEITDSGAVIKSYEILLRYADGDFFPFEIFNELTRTEEACNLLNQWYENKFTYYLNKYPEVIFNLNIDLQQMQYTSTWELLKVLSQFKKRIAIEMTEFYQVSNLEHKRLFFESMAYIRELGMPLAFDDVGNGQHSISFVTKNIHLVDMVKISLLHLEHLDPITVGLNVDIWVRIAKIAKVDLVIEGIENQTTADIMTSRGIIFQQGYFWSKPIQEI